MPVRLLLPSVAVLALLAVRPGVVVNGVRSPVAWLAVAGVLLLSLAARAGLRRAGASDRAGRVVGTAVVLVCAVALLAPSFRQRTLVEQVPVAAAVATVAPSPEAAAAPSPSAVAVASPAPVASPVRPGPADRSGSLSGIGHSARGSVALRTVDGVGYLVFEDVDVEGTVDPSVHLVDDGGRTPSGGVRIGGLEAERGTFSYRLPDAVDLSRPWSVLVWCDPYDTPIAAADLAA